MEVLTNVNLKLDEIKKVVKQENACIAWGGAANVSPADDVIIRVERSLDIDCEGHPKSKFQNDYLAQKDGIVKEINNRQISLIARLAGAPNDKAAGIDLLVKIGEKVKKGDLLFTIHSESLGSLQYGVSTLQEGEKIITIS